MNTKFVQKIQSMLDEQNRMKSSLESLLTFQTNLINLYKKLERKSVDLNLINDQYHSKETKLISLKLLEEQKLIKINNLPIAYIRDNTILNNNRYMNNLINKITSLKHLYNYTETT